VSFIRRISRRRLLQALAAGSGVAALVQLGQRSAFASDGIPLLIPEDIGADEHWVDVNLTEQAAVAMVGVDWVRVAAVTTGKDGWDTPEGEFRIVYRVANETMTSASLNISDPTDQYVLKDVLYTQYFTTVGHALHLNYWQPQSVFGNRRTSHGCVGMPLADAEFLWKHLGVGSRVVIHS
jgi:lipoprotein-anchoring transpeptidase ErfK/SrfK